VNSFLKIVFNNSWIKFFACYLSLLTFENPAQQILDSTFGMGGVSIVDLNGYEGIWSSAIQPDGKIVLTGWATRYLNSSTDITLVRFNSNGIFDSTFNSGNLISVNQSSWEGAYSIIRDSLSGALFVVGRYYNGLTWDFILAKFDSSGVLDNSFGNNGFVTRDEGGDDRAFSVALQDDGKILICGLTTAVGWDFAILRFLPDGSPDSSFGDGGITIKDVAISDDVAYSIKVQEENKIIVCGWTYGNGGDFVLMRFNERGMLDNTFGNRGIVITDLYNKYNTSHSVTLSNGGKYIVAGYGYKENKTNTDIIIAKYNNDGSIDSTFGESGFSFTDINQSDELAWFVATQEDGKIVVTGYTKSDTSKSVLTIRLNPDGSPDDDFALNGIAVTPVYGIDEEGRTLSIQRDGKILVSGYASNGQNTDIFVLRLRADNSTSVIIEHPEEFNLFQNYPNPFNSTTTIKYDLPETLQSPTGFGTSVTLIVYDILGRKIKTLVDEVKLPGSYEVKFDASDLSGGVYLYRMIAESASNSYINTRKMILLK
jgi:uncharacterized delta-60 repeat protein